MSTTSYRYQLLPYRTPASRSQCPRCGDTYRRTFAPYLDTRTGEILPAEYGRCNREEACGYHHSPYHTEADGLSYKDRLWQAKKTEFSEAYKKGAVQAPRPTLAERRGETPPPPPITLPGFLLEKSMRGYGKNRFVQLLSKHFGAAVADELSQRFQLGSSDYWPGACVFWQVDTQQRLRGGQVVQFDAEGHTAKAIQPDGSVRRRTSWAHTALVAHYTSRNLEVPEWLLRYKAEAPKSPCLFGLPQLTTAPASQPVAIVEAPKTAVLCTPYFPAFAWLAVGALSYLNAARLEPLRGRSIVLFPDASESGRAYAEWSQRAVELRRMGFRVDVSDLLETCATAEQKQQGIDLADLLLTQWPGYPPSWDTPSEDTVVHTSTRTPEQPATAL